jgi:uncharacterized hydrophobic protein (TIGR00271 family)
MENNKKQHFSFSVPLKNSLFSDITQKDRTKAIEEILGASCPRKSFFVMTTISAIICTLGISTGNAAVIIGGMLVAPMLSPILAIAMGVGMADFKLIYRSIRVVLLAIAYSLVFSYGVALLLDKPDPEILNHEMLLRVGVSLDTLLIALVAGLAASLSMIRAELHQYMAGIAIAVALIPPISMSAIGLRMLNLEIFYQAFMQFAFSLGGIILSAIVVFALSKFYVSKKKVEQELKEEEQMLNSDKQ